MKRIRRSISPLILIGLGVWFLLKRTASMEILGIVVMVLSGLGIVLSVTDKESTKTGKGLHIVVDGVFIAGGAWLLISPLTFTKYLKYILGAIIVLYAAFTLRRMFRVPCRNGFRIAEAVPILLGIGLMFIPLGEDVFPTAAGGALAATGLITLASNLFGRKKTPKTKAAPAKPAEGQASPEAKKS